MFFLILDRETQQQKYGRFYTIKRRNTVRFLYTCSNNEDLFVVNAVILIRVSLGPLSSYLCLLKFRFYDVSHLHVHMALVHSCDTEENYSVST